MRAARARSAGFGLLEAVVALTLLAGTGVVLFSWINQNVQDVRRLKVAEQEAAMLLSAQALIETVDPMHALEGELDSGDLHLRWVAQLIEPARSNSAFGPEGPVPGAWQLGLYRLAVQARDKQGLSIRFEQWRVGTRRLRPTGAGP